jgi:hypothetical protein
MHVREARSDWLLLANWVLVIPSTAIMTRPTTRIVASLQWDATLCKGRAGKRRAIGVSADRSLLRHNCPFCRGDSSFDVPHHIEPPRDIQCEHVEDIFRWLLRALRPFARIPDRAANDCQAAA